MTDIKDRLFEFGFRPEEIGFVPYCIYYKYKYCLVENHEEYEIVAILYSNGSYEIQRQIKQTNPNAKKFRKKNYYKGKISQSNPSKIIKKLTLEVALMKLNKGKI